MLEELDEKDQELSRLREECSKARAGVMRERKAKEELRHKMEEACENSKLQVCSNSLWWISGASIFGSGGAIPGWYAGPTSQAEGSERTVYAD